MTKLSNATGPEPEIDIWVCLSCGRTVTAPKLRTYDPDTLCRCRYAAGVITQMQLVKRPA